jgi:hypothetical protein
MHGLFVGTKRFAYNITVVLTMERTDGVKKFDNEHA